MPDTTIRPFSAFEDSGVSLMARIQGNAGTNITQASISSISMTAWDIDDEDAVTQVGVTTALTVASVVFDTLQTDARWDKDSTGYNFRHEVPASFTANPGKLRVEYRFVPASGENFAVVFEGMVKGMRGS